MTKHLTLGEMLIKRSKPGSARTFPGTSSEFNEQKKLFEWASHFPKLKFMFHIPNGGYRQQRHGAFMKMLGTKPGVPDIFLPIPNEKSNGLFIEMKYFNGRVAPSQKEYIDFLTQNNYQCSVCYSCDEAIKTITDYLGGQL